MLRAKVALGMPRNSATAIGSVPVYPSVDSTPPITRSNSPRLMAAARTLAVTNVSAPGRAASVISTPLWAPIDRARRMAASAGSGPMLRTVTWPPDCSASCSAASTTCSSPGSRAPSTPSRTRRWSGPICGVPSGFGMYLTRAMMFMGRLSYRGVGQRYHWTKQGKRPVPASLAAVSRTLSVLVAMSGGVDSSVSAALLHEQGYRVLGSHMKLVHMDGVDHGCCGPQAESDAAAVAELVGFEFEVADMSRAFERTVLADFFAEHRAGRTPNPCVRCNQFIKFDAFLARPDPDLVRPGEVVDPRGRTIAHHDGTFRFTIGQRRGLGVSTGERAYVVDMDGAANRVMVGPGE